MDSMVRLSQFGKCSAIAELLVEVVRQYSDAIGQPNGVPSWGNLSASEQDTYIKAVESALSKEEPPTLEEQHEAWMRARIADGWKYGPILNRAEKIHPLLVPYSQVPQPQRVKDILFRSIVYTMRDLFKRNIL